MKIVAAGVSGFLGRRLVGALLADGHQVTRLVRREPGEHEVRWDPDAGRLDVGVLSGADAVINLCGAGVEDKRWNDEYKQVLVNSRVRPTTLLARAMAETGVPVLLNASAIGYYGDRGNEFLTEDSVAGTGFFADLCQQWEVATEPATEAGARVVRMRTGLVIGRGGGLLPPLQLTTKLFLGGRLGTGRQWQSWVGIDDEIGAMLHLLTADLSGPVNLTGPEPVRNVELAKALGKVLHRPTPWIVPKFALKLVLGEFAEDILISQRVLPTKLPASGYRFQQPTLVDALKAEVS